MATNPNGANQHTPDQREQVCWDLYVESLTKGQPNAHQSALEAGYSKDHARNITMQGWFKERLEDLERKEMLSKAEKKLAKTLTYEVEGIDEEGNIKIKTDLLKIQTDVAKFVASTVGKNKGYSSRNEITDADGKPLHITFDTAFNHKNNEKT